MGGGGGMGGGRYWGSLQECRYTRKGLIEDVRGKKVIATIEPVKEERRLLRPQTDTTNVKNVADTQGGVKPGERNGCRGKSVMSKVQ